MDIISRILILIVLQIHHSVTDELVVCENGKETITCVSGTIAISFINYGRLNTETCPHTATSDTNCQSTTANSIVMAACQGLTTCTLSAKNNIYGDPCDGTYKYLHVIYTCAVSTTTTTSTTTPTTTTTSTTLSTPTTTTSTSPLLLTTTNTTSITTQLSTTTAITTQLTAVTSTYQMSTTKYAAAAGASVQSSNGSQTIRLYDGCYCTCVDIDLDLSDPVVLNTVISELQRKLLLDKKTLSRYKRSLTSVYEDKESGKAISVASFSFILLMLSVVFLADIHRFLSETCKCHVTRKKKYDSLGKESKDGTINRYIYYNHII